MRIARHRRERAAGTPLEILAEEATDVVRGQRCPEFIAANPRLDENGAENDGCRRRDDDQPDGTQETADAAARSGLPRR
jgi:hypothetical protein